MRLQSITSANSRKVFLYVKENIYVGKEKIIQAFVRKQLNIEDVSGENRNIKSVQKEYLATEFMFVEFYVYSNIF